MWNKANAKKVPVSVSYHTTGVADPCEPGGDEPPHSDAALSDGLTCRQLQEEQGNANNQHQQHVQQEESPCRGKGNQQLSNRNIHF